MTKWFTLAELAGADMEDYPITSVQMWEDSFELSCQLTEKECAELLITRHEQSITIRPHNVDLRYIELINDWTDKIKQWLETQPKVRLHTVTNSDYIQIEPPLASEQMLPRFLRRDW